MIQVRCKKRRQPPPSADGPFISRAWAVADAPRECSSRRLRLDRGSRSSSTVYDATRPRARAAVDEEVAARARGGREVPAAEPVLERRSRCSSGRESRRLSASARERARRSPAGIDPSCLASARRRAGRRRSSTQSVTWASLDVSCARRRRARTTMRRRRAPRRRRPRGASSRRPARRRAPPARSAAPPRPRRWRVEVELEVAAPDVAGVADRAHPAVLEQHRAVAEALDHRHVVGHEDDRAALVAQAAELVEALLLEGRVADGEHLVDQQHVGVGLDHQRRTPAAPACPTSSS